MTDPDTPRDENGLPPPTPPDNMDDGVRTDIPAPDEPEPPEAPNAGLEPIPDL